MVKVKMIDSSYSTLSSNKQNGRQKLIFGEEAASKPQAREFYLCFVAKFLNSTVSKDCFSQLKETAQFPYMYMT